jgi:RNA:NAD 2'-phosphotransferase (TPT1/KptA family)
MAKYSIDFPSDVVAAIKQELAEDAAALSDKAAVVEWVRRALGPVAKRYRRQAIGPRTDLETARITAEGALKAEVDARQLAEDGGDVQAKDDVQGVA